MNKIAIEIEENSDEDFIDVACTTEHGLYVLLMIGIIESWKECNSCKKCSVNNRNAKIILTMARRQSEKFGLKTYFKRFYTTFSEIFSLNIRDKIQEVCSKNLYNNLSIGIRCILAALSPKLSFSIMSGAVTYPKAMKEKFLNVLSSELNVIFVIKDDMKNEKYIESCRIVCPIINLVEKDNGYCLRYYKNQRHSHFDKALILKDIARNLKRGLMAK